MNKYTLDVLLHQQKRLKELLQSARYQDEVTFYKQTLEQVNKDIDNIDKNSSKTSENELKSVISE